MMPTRTIPDDPIVPATSGSVGQRALPNDPVETSGTGILKTIGSTLREIPEGLVKAGSGLSEWEAGKIAQLLRYFGAPDSTVQAAETFRKQQWKPEQIEAASDKAVNVVLPQAAEGPVKEWTQHQPQNPTEEGVAAVTSFIPSLLTKNPEGMSGLPALAYKGATRVLFPAAATETAGQVTRQISPEYENAVRFITGAISSPQVWKSTGAQAAVRQLSKSPGAMDALRQAVVADFGNTPEGFARAQTALQEMGIDATLMDIGPNLKLGGQQTYSKPGVGREAIHQKLTSRDEGYGQRFEEDVRGNVGPKVDEGLMLDALKQRVREGGQKQEASHSQQVAPIDLEPIIADIDTRLTTEKSHKIRSALTKVRRMMYGGQQPGHNQGPPLETGSAEVLSARQAIKEMLYEADGSPKAGLGPKEDAILKDIYAKLNKQLDPANPTLRAADAEIEAVKKEGEAFDVGKKDVLATDPNKAISPEQFARQWDALGPTEKAALRSGLTVKIDAIRGTTANERAALKRIVLGEGKWNHQKIAQIIGQEGADNLVRGMEREAKFQDTKSSVLHGSKTAETQTFDKAPAAIEIAKDAIDRTAAGGAVAGTIGAAVGLATSPIKNLLTKLGDRITAGQRVEMGKLLASGQPQDIVRAIQLLENAPGGRGGMLASALMARRAQQEGG